MKICIIPARGGSKRIPKKNIKSFCGKPIIYWSIKAAISTDIFDKVIVSTDDYQIAEIAQKYDAEIPFMRPDALSDDFTATIPVIKHAESLDVWNTANELVRVTSAAREKTATVEELTGSTITITSLGAMGGLGATPIINHPEVSIVSIHAARDRAVVREGEIVVRKMMNLTSSFDHRIIDGYDGALLIQDLKSMLENPATIFM